MNRHELIETIRRVRGRWKLILALRGLAVCAATLVLLVALSAAGFQRFGFTPESIQLLRWLVGLSAATVFGWAVLWPVLRRVSDERVALYIEECEPSLQAALISAVTLDRQNSEVLSSGLAKALVEDVAAKCRSISYGSSIDERRLKRALALAGGAVVMAAGILALGPQPLRHASRALLLPTPAAEAAAVMRIDVQPGNDTIARGADFALTAALHAFRADGAEVIVRQAGSGNWSRWPMSPGKESGSFEAVLFDVGQVTEYFVEAGTVRSPTYRIDVVDAPYVSRIALEYTFPAYTGMPARRIEEGGDVVVPKGTLVRIIATPTAPVTAGRIRLDDARGVRMQAHPDGTLSGTLRALSDALYHVELPALDGDFASASPQYAISIVPDQPPSVVFEKPGRDVKATAVDEIFVSARAQDDYGVARLELVYSVNGAAQQVRALTAGAPIPEAVAGHTFFLEELSLQPGDFVSYFARATDNNAVDGAKTSTTDIYFIEIRPFSREYRAAEQRGMPGGGGQEQQAGALSEQQRQIIAATFNVARDRATYTPQGYREAVTTIELSQRRLREQVETLVQRMRMRGVLEMDSTFARIAELLPQAADEMSLAEESLKQIAPSEALPPEQRALQQLLRAEALYREVQVQMGGDPMGGGGGQGSMAEDLADLFELELDKLRNQYEQVQRTQQEQTQQEIDEAMERLRELARRQQQEAERQRRAAAIQNAQAGGGGGAQRQLAEETEEAARQLERLARENPTPELTDAARRLREAAEAMRRSATQPGGRGLADANAAREQLEEARRRLQRNQGEELRRATEDARQRAAELREQQRQIARGVENLGANPSNEQVARMNERKAELSRGVSELENRLDRLSMQARGTEQEAARKLQEAADSMRAARLQDRIRASQRALQSRVPEYTRALEAQIARDLQQTEQQIAAAGSQIGRGSAPGREREALDRTRQLAQSMESMRERARNAQQGNPSANSSTGDNTATEASRSGSINGEQARQLRAEAGERLEELQQLRRDLRAQGINTNPVDRAIGQLRELQSLGAYNDPQEIERLLTQVARGLQDFEFSLRIRIEGEEKQRLFMAAPGQVPPEYRRAVEEYYRSLARPRQ